MSIPPIPFVHRVRSARSIYHLEGDIHAQYLLSIYQPDGPAPAPAVLTDIMRDVNAFMRELEGADAWIFNGGLRPPSSASGVRIVGAVR
jgi:hypothetical protein